MWIDKILYWQDDGINTVYPPPTQKRIEYAVIRYKGLPEMKQACYVYDDNKKRDVYTDELLWHKSNGAEIIYP